jgi:hypothetical protein
MVRTALVYLAVGFTIGASILWQKGLGSLPGAWRLLGAHIELVLVGWMLQLALGVAWWILPRLRVDGRPTRGRESRVWLSYGLLNAGIWAVVVAPWFGPAVQPALMAVGRVAEALAVVVFATQAWPRVRAAGGGAGRASAPRAT